MSDIFFNTEHQRSCYRYNYVNYTISYIARHSDPLFNRIDNKDIIQQAINLLVDNGIIEIVKKEPIRTITSIEPVMLFKIKKELITQKNRPLNFISGIHTATGNNKTDSSCLCYGINSYMLQVAEQDTKITPAQAQELEPYLQYTGDSKTQMQDYISVPATFYTRGRTPALSIGKDIYFLEENKEVQYSYKEYISTILTFIESARQKYTKKNYPSDSLLATELIPCNLLTFIAYVLEYNEQAIDKTKTANYEEIKSRFKWSAYKEIQDYYTQILTTGKYQELGNSISLSIFNDPFTNGTLGKSLKANEDIPFSFLNSYKKGNKYLSVTFKARFKTPNSEPVTLSEQAFLLLSAIEKLCKGIEQKEDYTKHDFTFRELYSQFSTARFENEDAIKLIKLLEYLRSVEVDFFNFEFIQKEQLLSDKTLYDMIHNELLVNLSLNYKDGNEKNGTFRITQRPFQASLADEKNGYFQFTITQNKELPEQVSNTDNAISLKLCLTREMYRINNNFDKYESGKISLDLISRHTQIDYENKTRPMKSKIRDTIEKILVKEIFTLPEYKDYTFKWYYEKRAIAGVLILKKPPLNTINLDTLFLIERNK